MNAPLSRTPLFKTNGIGRMFGDGTKALDRVTMTVEQGSVTSLLGPSGCGKSTLLRIIAGLDMATAGVMDWPGGVLKTGETGFVFQDATLLPWASVWDNVYLPFRIKGTSRAEAAAAVDSVLRLVELDGFAEHYPRQLSGGMRMRVAVARALATKPRLLLMDEPFAALDEMTRYRLNDDLLRIQQDLGCTLLFVTHSVYEAVYLSRQVCVMTKRPGHVMAEIPIDLPWPREPDMRTSSEFAKACRIVSDALTGKVPV
jgi:NitT/TauT family transport system ATP-binding protein